MYIFSKNVKFEDSSVNKQEIFYNAYLKNYFDLDELFSEELINNYDTKCLQFMELVALQSLYNVRIYFNKPIHINNWKLVKEKKLKTEIFSNRVVRFPNLSYYSKTSEHAVIIDMSGNITKRSSAIDCDISGLTSSYVRTTIISNKDNKFFNNITRMENKVNWLHFDHKKVKDRIVLFNP